MYAAQAPSLVSKVPPQKVLDNVHGHASGCYVPLCRRLPLFCTIFSLLCRNFFGQCELSAMPQTSITAATFIDVCLPVLPGKGGKASGCLCLWGGEFFVVQTQSGSAQFTCCNQHASLSSSLFSLLRCGPLLTSYIPVCPLHRPCTSCSPAASHMLVGREGEVKAVRDVQWPQTCVLVLSNVLHFASHCPLPPHLLSRGAQCAAWPSNHQGWQVSLHPMVACQPSCEFLRALAMGPSDILHACFAGAPLSPWSPPHATVLW